MKLKEAESWLMGTLQRNLFPGLEECCERSLTEKEQQLTNILSLVAMEPFADRACPQRFGRKRRETGEVFPANQGAVCLISVKSGRFAANRTKNLGFIDLGLPIPNRCLIATTILMNFAKGSPDRFLIFSGHRGWESSLTPGNYDLSLKPIEYSVYSLIKLIKNQITLLHACHPRLVKVNAYNRTMNNVRIYGNLIKE